MDSPEARRALCAYDWPGNVRELQNVMERACVLCDGGRIELSDLPPALQEFASRATDVAESWACEPHPPGPAGAEAALAVEALPPGLDPRATTKPGPSAGFGSLKDFVREQELGYLARALAQTGGDKEKAAQLLGISLATLYRKLAGEDLHY
jgi:DNA-binding NtrC family response regulator